jgi:hypothetical protein
MIKQNKHKTYKDMKDLIEIIAPYNVSKVTGEDKMSLVYNYQFCIWIKIGDGLGFVNQFNMSLQNYSQYMKTVKKIVSKHLDCDLNAEFKTVLVYDHNLTCNI